MAQKGKNTPKKEQVAVIDCTPTWAAVLPWWLEVLRNGNGAGKESAKLELMRMAKVADMCVEYQKQEEQMVNFLELLVDKSYDVDKDKVDEIKQLIKAYRDDKAKTDRNKGVSKAEY